jgi:Protein of unknown function (DUF4238)
MIYPWLMRMRWTWLRIEGDEEFVTCDNPFSWVDPTLPSGFYSGGGLGMTNVEVTFPIGPKVCLLATWVGPTGSVRARAPIVYEMNRRRVGFASQYVFTTSGTRARSALQLFREEGGRAEKNSD